MASRPRDGPPAKEKRGTSPSQVPITGTAQRRRSPVPSKPISPARSLDTSASEKQAPNYLKPTASSRTDISKQLQGKKPVPSTDSTNRTLARRRSFDKPPSPSGMQKSRVSPNPTLRSSSFSGKTVSSQKTAPDRNVKAPKDAGKQHSSYARPVSIVKKSTTGIKKQETGSGSSARKEQLTSPPEKVEVPNVHDHIQEPEMQSKDQETSVAETGDYQMVPQNGNSDEEEVKDPLLEDHKEEAKDYSSLEDQELVNVEQTEAAESDDNAAKIVPVESDSSKVLEHQDASPGIEAEELAEKSEAEEINRESEERTTNEVSKINAIENVGGRPNEEIEENERQEVEEEEEEEANALDKKEAEAPGIEAHESGETEVREEVVMEEKEEAENTTPKVAQVMKDSPVSNDVIEETANKLREQRKNKVKALAGAFETVISLQEPK